MFYPIDYVTSKNPGLRIVWLASTLGSDSRKLTKKDFNAVDVSKTCRNVADPKQPLALRTSGQLMHGVARIYTKQAEYWMVDVQTHYNALRKLLSEGGASTKKMGGLVIVGKDTTTIDMPGRGRQNQDSITLPSRFDFFASHANADFHWGSNEVMGDSDIFTANLASVLGGSQLSPSQSSEFAVGRRFSSQQRRDRYTLEPNQSRRLPSTSSSVADFAPFDLNALLTEVQEGEGVDLGLDTAMEVDLPPLDDFRFEMHEDMPLDLQQLDMQMQAHDILSPSRHRPRSNSVESLVVPHPVAKRTRFALADSSIELSNEAVLSWRDNYASNMAELRLSEAQKQTMRRATQDSIRLPFGPGLEIRLASDLVDVWEKSVSASKIAAESHKTVIEDPGVGRNEADLAPPPPVVWQEDYDMPQYEEPGFLEGAFRTSSPQYENEVARGSQSSEKQTRLPWNQPISRMEVEDITLGGDTTSVHSNRSFLVETPTGLRRQSNRQSSIGAASVGQEIADRDEGHSFPQNTQDIADKEASNFLTYANRVRAQVPSDQPLFFSDLAPIADSTAYIAASAFYHTLALATSRLLRVEQQSAFGEIKIEIVMA